MSFFYLIHSVVEIDGIYSIIRADSPNIIRIGHVYVWQLKTVSNSIAIDGMNADHTLEGVCMYAYSIKKSTYIILDHTVWRELSYTRRWDVRLALIPFNMIESLIVSIWTNIA